MNNLHSPELSILMCAHNESQYIEESIRSVLSESKVNLELVVVDDRSSDNTNAIIRNWASQDSRVVLISRVAQPNIANVAENKYYIHESTGVGQAAVSNLGLRFCRGKYIARLDADDICVPGRFATQVNFMHQHGDISFLGANAYRIDERGKVMGVCRSAGMDHEEIVKRIYNFQGSLPHSSWLVKREVFQKLDGYNKSGFLSLDLDFMLRASELPEVKFAFIFEPLIYYRMHTKSISFKSPLKSLEHAIYAVTCSLLRRDGYKNIPKHEATLLSVIRDNIKAVRLDKKALAYMTLKNAFVNMRARNYLQAIADLTRVAFLSPTTFFYYKSATKAMAKVAHDTHKQFTVDLAKTLE